MARGDPAETTANLQGESEVGPPPGHARPTTSEPSGT